MLEKTRKKIKKHLTGRWKQYLWGLVFIAIFSLGITAGYLYFKKNQSETLKTLIEAEKNVYIGFLSEVYDKIKENYWEKITDEQLGNFFKLGVENLTKKPQDLKIKDKNDFKKMLAGVMKIVKENKKKEFSVTLAHVVLQNLKPLGRSALYTIQDKENLKNQVHNINPQANLYEILGINKDASEKELEEAYENKITEGKELEKVKYAYEVLSDSTGKIRYDQAGIEPTVFAKLVRPSILHLYIKKMSPTILEEIKKETEKFDDAEGLDSMIIDLRANVGGSIDVLPYFLGPFVGKDQYVYEFFHQGEYTPFKTKIGWLPSLVKYKKVVILVDSQTQSSAELMAAALKKYNVGILVGTTTKGWGTIEAVFDIEQQLDEEEKYSMFLVHSLTLRDDNQPIQGNGVNPLISINDPGWEQQLFAYFHYDELTEAVKEIWDKPPGKL